jgi:hypothetical protein
VNQFKTIKQAKDYLANRIVAEAAREGVPLSETERKMLYFSESDWTLPDMVQVSAEFDRNYDQNEYEDKIAGLVLEIGMRDHSQSQTDTEAWDEAVEELSEGDNYLSLLVSPIVASTPGLHGYLPTLEAGPVRPPHDRLKLWITALAILFGIIGLMAIGNWLFGARFWAVIDWFLGDRDHFGLIVLLAVAIWFLWFIRNDLKIIVKGLMRRR